MKKSERPRVVQMAELHREEPWGGGSVCVNDQPLGLKGSGRSILAIPCNRWGLRDAERTWQYVI